MKGRFVSNGNIPTTAPMLGLSKAVGGLLLLSGVLHTAVWLFDGGSWEGPLSWRKPILFGFSAGVTVLSLDWLTTKLPRFVGDRFIVGFFSIGMLIEVALITLQTWRGVPSHFNRSTALDARVLNGIEVLIALATVVIAYYTIRSLGMIRAPRDMRLAIRSGLILLLVACLFGFFMVDYGNSELAAGRSPETYGQRGVMKFPHGVPIHAIQILPLVAWSLQTIGIRESVRTQIVGLTLLSTLIFTGFSVFQTLGGRGRFELTPTGGGLLLLTIIPLVISIPLVYRSRTAPAPTTEGF